MAVLGAGGAAEQRTGRCALEARSRPLEAHFARHSHTLCCGVAVRGAKKPPEPYPRIYAGRLAWGPGCASRDRPGPALSALSTETGPHTDHSVSGTFRPRAVS
eukprot:7322355-Prymnesium_polylepis.2